MKPANFMTSMRFVLYCLISLLFQVSTGCSENELPQQKPIIELNKIEFVGYTNALLWAKVVPNTENATIDFEYKDSRSATWINYPLPGKFSGSEPIVISQYLKSLKNNTLYNYRFIINNPSGKMSSTIGSFVTTGPTQSEVLSILEDNETLHSVKLIAKLIPNQNNTTISFIYLDEHDVWKTVPVAGTFKGDDTITVSVDVTNLLPNRVYKYRLQINNVAGLLISDIKTFGTFLPVDFDGNTYSTVIIGNQTWLKENFRGSHYLNGDAIPYAKNPNGTVNEDGLFWKPAVSSIYNERTYGYLYKWSVAYDQRGLIRGYHTPTKDEWYALIEYLGNESAGAKLKETGDVNWVNQNLYSATNSSGFTALPAGSWYINKYSSITSNYIKEYVNVLSENFSYKAYFWTKSIDMSTNKPYYYVLTNGSSGVGCGTGSSTNFGISIRLIKD